MSLIICTSCTRTVDSDFEDYHCDESGEYCLACREAWEAENIGKYYADFAAAKHYGLLDDQRQLLRDAGRGHLAGDCS